MVKCRPLRARGRKRKPRAVQRDALTSHRFISISTCKMHFSCLTPVVAAFIYWLVTHGWMSFRVFPWAEAPAVAGYFLLVLPLPRQWCGSHQKLSSFVFLISNVTHIGSYHPSSSSSVMWLASKVIVLSLPPAMWLTSKVIVLFLISNVTHIKSYCPFSSSWSAWLTLKLILSFLFLRTSAMWLTSKVQIK